MTTVFPAERTVTKTDDLPAWGHFAALDGVRGIAVIVVLLFHGGVSWAQGGFLGVDAFFVLSGLLITSLLLDEMGRTDSVALGRFWSRRARRLLPALFLVVAACGVYGAVFAAPGALATLRGDALASLAYVANWRFIATGSDYFVATSEPSVLRHMWSLAIEEQFYLVWPLVLLAVARLRHRALLVGAISTAGIVASVAVMAALHEPGRDPGRVYYGTDARAHVVLTGALLAAVLAAVRRNLPVTGAGLVTRLGLTAAAVAGAGAFAAAVVLADGDDRWLYQGGFLAVAVAVAAVLASVVLDPDGWPARVLSFQPLRAVGLVSYGLYLWHWPVYLTLTSERTSLSGPGLLALRIAVTAALSICSYYAVELPIRNGALPQWRAQLATPAVAAAVIAAVLVGTQLPSAGPVTAAAARTQSGFPASRRPLRPPGWDGRVMVLGDSVPLTLAQHLEKRARRYDVELLNHATLGCGLIRGTPFRYFGDELRQPDNCVTWPEQWRRLIGELDPDVVWLTVGRWEVMDRVVKGTWSHIGDPAFDAQVTKDIELAIEILTAQDATLALTTAPYYKRGERPDGGQWPEDETARVDRFNQILRDVVGRYADRVALLELNERTSVGGTYTEVIDGIRLRYDGVHFSVQGARWLEPWLLGALREMSPLATTGDPPPPDTPTTGPPVSQSPRPTTAPTAPPRTTPTTDPESPPTTERPPEPPPTTTVIPPVTFAPQTSTTATSAPTTTEPRPVSTTTPPER